MKGVSARKLEPKAVARITEETVGYPAVSSVTASFSTDIRGTQRITASFPS